MHTLFLLIGSNMGDRLEKLNQSKTIIQEHIGKIKIASSIYETAPWGITDQPHFLNQVLEVETQLPATVCMEKIIEIEHQMGRIRTIKNAARIIDIDILFYDNDIINSETLVIPHPEIPNRRFVLIPMNELSPAFIHPVLKKSIHTLLTISKDPLEVSAWFANSQPS